VICFGGIVGRINERLNSNMVRIAAEKLESALSRLDALDVKKQSEYSLRESIKQILPSIQSVIEKGYSFDEVANLLQQDEINISGTTLRQYVREFSKGKSSGVKAKKNEDKSSKAESAIAQEKIENTKSSGVKAKKNEDKSSKVEPVVAQKKIENTKISVVKNDKIALGDELYKSPPKPGSEQFK
jgi:hypothetical protein